MSQDKLSATLAIATATRNFKTASDTRPGDKKLSREEPKTTTPIDIKLINTGVPKVARTM